MLVLGVLAVTGVGSKPTFAKLVYLYIHVYIYIYNLPERVQEDTLLATFDIEALYSNIPGPLCLTHRLGNTEIKNVFGTDFGNCFEKNWKWFLDDCFVPWTNAVHELKTLHEILNKLHKDISFTIQFSNLQQSFLDIQFKIKKDA